MNVVELHGERDMRIVQAARPVPGPGEVLLRIRAVGICGSDLHYYKEGGIGDAVVNEPLIIGHEFAAEVAELGPGVTGLFVGQPVAVEPAMPCHHCELCVEGNSNLCPSVRFAGSPGVQGAMREYMVHPAANCFPLLPGMTFADGAVLEPLGIGIHAVDLGKQKVGATVAVLGCGPIGLLTMQVARAAGASRIFATDLLDYRLEAAKKCGATETYNAKRDDVVQAITQATGGRGVDVVYECSGALDTPDQAMHLARAGGTVVLVGIPSEDHTTFTASVARRKGLTIKMSRRMREVYPRSLAMAAAAQVDLRVVVSHHVPLSQVGEAMEMLEHYEDGVLKVIVDI